MRSAGKASLHARRPRELLPDLTPSRGDSMMAPMPGTAKRGAHALGGAPSPAVVAGLLSLLGYFATASAHGYWLDGGEFVAAAAELGIPHPPGQPLAVLLSATVVNLLPLGSIAFRVALASALMASLATLFLYRATDQTLIALGLKWPRARQLIALGATLSVAASYGFWFQAVRPEVYALQAALLCFALERLVHLEAGWPRVDVRPLYQGGLALGLALANHHFLAFLILPAAAPTLARVIQAKGRRPLLLGAGAVLTGLTTYVFLPLRAAAGAGLALGQPDSLSRFIWVVSAEAFQKNQGDGVPQPLGDRFMDVLVSLVESMHPAVVLLALGGAWAVLRVRPSRRIGLIWVSVVITFVMARAWLGFVRSNPDALGYLMPAMAALGALAACFVGAVAQVIGGDDARRANTAALLLAGLVFAGGVYQVSRNGAQTSLAGFADTDAFDDPLRRDLPPRAVVLLHGPQTVFRYWGGEAQERLRPDVAVVPIPLLGYPKMVELLVARDPELADLLRAYLLEGELTLPGLQSLAAQRPLLVELDVRVDPRLYGTLIPNGLYHEVVADGATQADERRGAEVQEQMWAHLHQHLHDSEDRETQAQLLWRHYTDALYFAGFGDLDAARKATHRARAVSPEAMELVALEAALEQAPEGARLDVRPFLANTPPE